MNTVHQNVKRFLLQNPLLIMKIKVSASFPFENYIYTTKNETCEECKNLICIFFKN